jgi:hypothetical protein
VVALQNQEDRQMGFKSSAFAPSFRLSRNQRPSTERFQETSLIPPNAPRGRNFPNTW